MTTLYRICFLAVGVDVGLFNNKIHLTGEYYNTKDEGVYRCACCGADLFSSDTKYDSGSGWPSFWEPMNEENVKTESDNSLFMRRTEVLCAVFESLAESAAGDLESAIDQFPDEVAPLVREALERQKSWEVPSS